MKFMSRFACIMKFYEWICLHSKMYEWIYLRWNHLKFALASRFCKNGVAIHKFKRKFTFGLPRICTLTLCKFSQWHHSKTTTKIFCLSYRQSPCHTYKFFRINLIFVIPTALLSYWAFGEVSKKLSHCHTELSQESEVSTNSKCKFTF